MTVWVAHFYKAWCNAPCHRCYVKYYGKFWICKRRNFFNKGSLYFVLTFFKKNSTHINYQFIVQNLLCFENNLWNKNRNNYEMFLFFFSSSVSVQELRIQNLKCSLRLTNFRKYKTVIKKLNKQGLNIYYFFFGKRPWCLTHVYWLQFIINFLGLTRFSILNLWGFEFFISRLFLKYLVLNNFPSL